jgi:hypothetical protein
MRNAAARKHGDPLQSLECDFERQKFKATG